MSIHGAILSMLNGCVYHYNLYNYIFICIYIYPYCVVYLSYMVSFESHYIYIYMCVVEIKKISLYFHCITKKVYVATICKILITAYIPIMVLLYTYTNILKMINHDEPI